MSIKLNDQYTLKWDRHNWQLDETLPSKHHKSKDGARTQSRWFPTLEMAFKYIFDNSIKDCTGTSLEDLQHSVTKSLELINELVAEVNK